MLDAMRRKSTVAVLVALAATLSACGGAGGGDDAKAAKAISDSIVSDQDAGSDVMQVGREDADCIGDGLVDKIGTDQLQEYGLLTEDLKVDKQVTNVKFSTEDAKAATDTLFDCTDVMGMISKTMPTQGMDEATRKCFEDVLTEDAVRGMFVNMFSGKQDEASKALVEPMMKCAAAQG